MKSAASSAIVEQIELWTSERQSKLALEAIRSYVSLAAHDTEAILQGAEWLRRLGEYREGYLLILKELEVSHSPRLLSWCARFLYLQGATSFALSILQTMPLDDPSDLQFAGEAFLADFDFEKADALLTRAWESRGDRHSRKALLSRLALADAKAGRGDFQEALRIVSEIQDTPGLDDMMNGVCLSCEGEYLARQGEFAQAVELLRKADAFLPREEQGLDRALLKKWLGYSLARQGQEENGLLLMNESLETFQKLRLREESWLDIMRLQAELGLIPEEKIRRLAHYPGISSHFRKILQSSGANPGEFRLGPPDAPYEIDLGSQEYALDRQWKPSLPLELRLLANLRIAEGWGIGTMRAMGLLWPLEPFSLHQLERRLDQLILRLRRVHGIQVTVHQGALFLNESEFDKVAIHLGGPISPVYLRNRAKAEARGVARFYGLGVTQAYARIQIWRDQGWLPNKFPSS